MGFQPQYSPHGHGGNVDEFRGRSRAISTGRSDSDYYIHGRGREDSFRAAPDGGSTAPDRRSVVPSSGTFYREPTPPLLPQTRDTNLDASSTTNILQKAGEFYDYQYDHVAPPASIPAATICGVKARLFWLLLGAVALLVVIAPWDNAEPDIAYQDFIISDSHVQVKDSRCTRAHLNTPSFLPPRQRH
ncbi:hypothetical protein A9Z42_0078870 [Trichoderma parareesei]|uniref:Uncharacterized protein n=1 Tax=Trichoderma parareesei TaxID=858221 RepID=A0A2H2Z462_TRIPA|nr:hypothetical protein A9Z42_0078870 [Trichoderma parareesei]